MAFSALYRVLDVYPKNKLMIIEGDLASAPDRRITGVTYHQLKLVWSRLLRTRLHRYLSLPTMFYMPFRANALERLVRNIRPEAVMTMVYGYAWASAAAYAARAGLPLHLIVHDDREGRFEIERRVVDWQLRHWNGKAAWLCVSPYMARLSPEV